MTISNQTSQLEPFRAKWTEADGKHLFKCTMFGARRNDIAHVQKRSLKKALHKLLFTEEPLQAPPISNSSDVKFIDDEGHGPETGNVALLNTVCPEFNNNLTGGH